ncbi:ATP-binding protein [Rhodoferax sp. GW822-FHT02A01]|uniref:ATP-binding protein n=1 Tax=Rhodoferax sp. GW822-FHT02A01 TaxID=3141537 RepID=UPI00315C940A
MSFTITARTILHLGSDLISSDGVAIYELVKNAIDANSKDGVEIEFDIVIRESDFASCMTLIDLEEDETSLEELKEKFKSKINSEAEETLKETFFNAIDGSRSKDGLKRRALEAYKTCNRITFIDSGTGMSRSDLHDIYLTIGTTHRAKAVRESLRNGEKRPPYLGEKGVGRLSVMRLGWRVRVETATTADIETNVLDIDWRKFEEADDAEASSVQIETKSGKPKRKGDSGTRITVSDLRSSWSVSRLRNIARDEIARMADPFSWEETRRFRVRLSINGVAISSPRSVANDLLKHAHAKCTGSYFFDKETCKPALTATINSELYNGLPRDFSFDLTDLMSMSGLKDNGQPWSVLKSLGSFKFELYWFNRQRLKAIAGIGDREEVRKLVKAWTGICLFRDGYRVLPYGGEGDDWLHLDMEALSASGYKLNTKQIIGRVTIGRLENPKLLDQTNRQGLIESPEKEALISTLHELVSTWWHDYLNDVIRVQKKTSELAFDTVSESTVVQTLEERATTSIKEIRQHYTGEARLLAEVKDAFLEIKDAHERAVQRIGAIEEEKERLTQLAGIGLLVEMIAHELARATELTQSTLKDLSRKNIGVDASSSLKTLSSQIKVIQKRLVALEPLAISARFRRSVQRLAPIISYIFDGHIAQFGVDRHNISFRMNEVSNLATVGFIVEGHLVQIIENLIANSVYWMDVHKKEHPSFKPEIVVTILSDPPRVIYADNGPGIPKERAESVFEAFFSTKKGSAARRQGLGLYIARQNAEAMGGSLNLIAIGIPHKNRYNTFELELKEGADES